METTHRKSGYGSVSLIRDRIIPDFCLDALLRSFLFYVILYYYYVEFSLSQQNPAGAKGRTMLAIERKNEILQKLRADQRVLVSELAAHYQVTEETIRRDLDKLEKEGYATKTYGGAILGNSTKTDLSHAIRSKTNVEFKNQIADLVCQMVDDGDHLMIDDSSTGLFCAKKLRDKKNLTIITTSVELVVELANVETWTILLTGGRLKAESLALVGSQCEKYLSNYHVDKVFVSCKGLDRNAGVTDSNELTALIKQAMLRAGRQKILVVDSSKFDKVSFVNITPVSGVEAIVTNARPSEAWLRYFDDHGVRCIYPKE